jgi:arylsulfatase A-like enzyme
MCHTETGATKTAGFAPADLSHASRSRALRQAQPSPRHGRHPRADHLGCYGSKAVATPAIDALAARGVLYSRAFAHTPTTLPSHANILLGVTPNAHGVHDNSNFIVREDLLTLSEWLKGQGYATAAFIGAFPLDSRFGLVQGFDVYDDNYGSQGPTDMTFVERKATSS